MRALRHSGLVFAFLAVAAMPVWGADAPRPRVLPAGTPFELQLETALSTADNAPGDSFAARVARTVYLNGRVAVPAGSIVEGRVATVQDRAPATGVSALLLRPDFLTLPNGEHFTLSAEVTNAVAATSVRVGDEGEIEASRAPNVTDARRATEAGGAGLITGAVLAGAKGAMFGLGAGAAFAGGWYLIARRHASLNPGAVLDIRLDRPLALIPNSAVPAAAPSVPRLQSRPAPVPARAATTPAAPAAAASGAAPSASPASSSAAPAPAPPAPTVQDLAPPQS